MLAGAGAGDAARASARAASAAAAAAGGLTAFRDDAKKYYFVVDLVKKALVAILTGGVLVAPLRQVGVILAAVSAQALFVVVVAPIKDPLYQVRKCALGQMSRSS